MSTPLRERPDAPLGTLIFRAGLLPAETIESALEEGVKTGKRLGEILTERGLLKEADLARLLAGQKGLEFVTLREQIVDPAAAVLFSEDQARLFRALPYAFENGTPLVAIADPTDEVLTRNISEALGREDAKFVVSVRSELAEIIGQVYAEPFAAPPVPEPVVAAPEPEAVHEPEPAHEPDTLDEPDAIPQPGPAPAPAPEVSVPEPEPVLDFPIAEPVFPTPDPQPVAPAAPEPAPEPAPEIHAAPEAPHQNGSGSAEHVEMPALPSVSEPAPPVEAPTPEPVAAPESLVTPVETPQPVHQVPEMAPIGMPEPAHHPAPAVFVQPEADEPVSAPSEAAAEPLHLPEAPVASESPASYRLSVRLTNGERVEAGTYTDLDAAKQQAKALMAKVAAADTGDWPFVSGRFLKPDTIVSVDIL